MGALRTIFRYWLWVLLAAVVLQIAFAGFGAFDVADKLGSEGASVDEESFNDSWGLHTGFGYLIFLGAIVTFLLALAARVGRQRVLHSLGIVGLVVVQILLAWFGSEWAIIGALHPLNAFVILGAVAALTMREWRGDRMTTATPVAPPPAT
ncbi:MAG TPA: DUF6220 domain-containing protein [Gaiellaceae bacterium]|nr:DUF6220 domain-containing protein [Gaiellaceae bacterium]